MTLAIVSPGYPDAPGGVTAHTRRLVASWGAAGHDVHVVGDVDRDPAAIVPSLRAAGVRALLLQYVPFMYGRRGLSRAPAMLLKHARAGGIRTAVFVHEPWVPPTRLPWIVLSPLQQRQTRQVVRLADVTVTPVPAWQALLGGGTQLQYVGSTLTAGDTTPAPTAPSTAPVVFSPFASGLRWDWVVAAGRALGTAPPLTVIGATADEARARLPARAAPGEWLGHLPPGEVLARLERAPLVLAPFVDGLTARRTSALAALSVGARVVSSAGHLLDPLFADGPAALPETEAEFVSTVRRLWQEPDPAEAGAERRAWYDRYFDARMLDLALLHHVTGSP